MTLKINLDSVNQEMINVPYLKIQYRERSAAFIETNSLAQVSFYSDYFMNTAGFWRGATAAFIAFMIIMVVIILSIACTLIDRPTLNEEYTARLQYLVIKVCIIALDIYSTIFFWFLFALTGYWFIFFKLQERVYCFLPELTTLDNYLPFTGVFYSVFAAKFVFILFKIYFEQSSMDVFLIDWERPKF